MKKQRFEEVFNQDDQTVTKDLTPKEVSALAVLDLLDDAHDLMDPHGIKIAAQVVGIVASRLGRMMMDMASDELEKYEEQLTRGE